jgi:hypothetical protein
MCAAAFVRTMPRKRGERFIRELASIAASEETVRVLLPQRPAAQRRAIEASQDEAANMIRAMIPLLVASLPPET